MWIKEKVLRGLAFILAPMIGFKYKIPVVYISVCIQVFYGSQLGLN